MAVTRDVLNNIMSRFRGATSAAGSFAGKVLKRGADAIVNPIADYERQKAKSNREWFQKQRDFWGN